MATDGWVSRRGPAFVVVSGRFVTSIGFFLVVPFLTIYLTADVGMSVAEAGLLFAVLNFTRRGLGIPAGWASDRFGARQALVIGLLGEVAAYIGFAVATSFWPWLLAVSLLGAGGSLTSMGSRSLLASAPGQDPAISFSRFYVMVNAAALIGPLLGAVLIGHRLVWVTFAAAAALHFALAAFAWIVIPADAAGTPPAVGPAAVRSGALAEALRDRALIIYCCLTLGCWFFDAQFYVALPLTIEHQHMSAVVLGPLNAANALTVMVAVWLLGRWVTRRAALARLDVLAVSAVVQGGGWMLCAVSGLPPIVLAILVVSLGEALFMAVVDVIAAALAPAGRTGIYLGFSSMAWAIGAVLGSLTATAFGVAARHGALGVYWGVFAVIGLVTGLLVWAARRRLAAAVDLRAAAGAGLAASGAR